MPQGRGRLHRRAGEPAEWWDAHRNAGAGDDVGGTAVRGAVRAADVARAEPFCSVAMRRVEVLKHRLLPGIADPSLEVNQASASAKDK